jgi:hypothetical protein
MDDLLPLRVALQEFRAERGLTQVEAGALLGISRKTYVLFESCRWLPPEREYGHFIKRLHDFDPEIAQLLMRITGRKIDDHVVVRDRVVTSGSAASASQVPALGAVEAKRAFDVAVFETAEELEMSAGSVRPIVAAVLAKLAGTAIALGQAAELAQAAAEKKGKGRED